MTRRIKHDPTGKYKGKMSDLYEEALPATGYGRKHCLSGKTVIML